MKIPLTELIERLHRATGDAATAQLLEAAANRIAELEAKVEGYRLSSIEQWRRKKEWQARCSDLYAQGERHQVPCTSRADTICPQPAYCHANGCKAQAERQPDDKVRQVAVLFQKWRVGDLGLSGYLAQMEQLLNRA